MQAAPTASSHQDVTAASASPAGPATKKQPNAAASTCSRRRESGGDQPDRPDPPLV